MDTPKEPAAPDYEGLCERLEEWADWMTGPAMRPHKPLGNLIGFLREAAAAIRDLRARVKV